MTIAQQLKAKKGQPGLELPESTMQIFHWDRLNRTFLKVATDSQGVITRNTAFPPLPGDKPAPGKHFYYDAGIEGQDVRVVALALPSAGSPTPVVQVQVAETLRKRQAITELIIMFLAQPQIAIQLLASSVTCSAVTHNLRQVDDIAGRGQVARWTDQAVAHGIDLGYEGPDDAVMFCGESSLLRELIGSLLDNAIRYTSAGGTATLMLSPNPPRITIEDDGTGIPVDEQQRVFERFYRLPGSTDEGCGLGPSIAKEIAARHGALLTLHSVPGIPGTTAEIVFDASAAILSADGAADRVGVEIRVG